MVAALRRINISAQRYRMCSNHGFLPFVGYFFARRAKNNLQKKDSTMLPQARIASA